jgi:hypothetical protein
MNGGTIKRFFGEKIKINRMPVPKAQRDGGAAVKHKAEFSGSTKFWPKTFLRGRKNVHVRLENTHHGKRLDGMGGT